MKKQKILALLVICQVIFLTCEPLVVQGFLLPSSGDVSSDVRDGINTFLEDDLNINVSESLKPITEGINTMDRKGQTPEVSIRFSTPNPKEGEKITASADVFGISNVNNAYYTWLLKRAGDGYGPAEKLHQNAIKAQTSLYFDPEMFDQPFNEGLQNSAEADDDGYNAKMGGNNGLAREDDEDGEDYCYIYDVVSGEQLEIIGDASGGDTGCPDGYVARCMIESREVQCPTIIDPIDTVAETEETSTSSQTTATVSGADGARFEILTQCLDTGVTPTCDEGSETLHCGSSNGTNFYDADKYYLCDDADCEDYDELSDCRDDADNPLDCKKGDEMMGAVYNYSGSIDISTPFCIRKDDSTNQLWNDPNIEGCPFPEGGTHGGSLDGQTGGGCLSNGSDVIIPESCSLRESEDNKCTSEQHIFNSDAVASMNDAVEAAYGTNPIDTRTTPMAENDGMLIAGVGMKDFTWKYEEGDEISVVVEGMGTVATKHEDATYQTVFALPKPGCGEFDSDDIDDYEETIKQKVVQIKTVDVNIAEDCISADIFSKPGTSEYDALDVTVSSGGSSGGSNTQAAIPSGLGIEKTITATAGQTQGGSISQPSDLYYEWDVQCQGESIKNDEDFKDNITSKTKGTNLKNLTLITDFPNGKDEDGNENGSTNCFDENGQGEITITAKINEPRSGGGSNFGQSTTTLSVYDIEDNPLKVYKTEIDNGQYQTTTNQICDEDIDRVVCRVMNNEVVTITAEEIIEASVDEIDEDGIVGQISWTIDGKPYSCDESVSEQDCRDNYNTSRIVVPFEGRDGDFVSVTVNMSDVSSDTNQKKQVTRMFRITEPSVMITPQGNTVNRKVLGVYKNLRKKEYLDESETDFEIEEGETAVFSAMLYPEFLNTNTDGITYEWYIDGELYDTEKTIYYVPDSDTSISVKASIAKDKTARKALRDVFGVSQSETVPTTFNQTIQLNIKESTAVAQGVGGFFATAQHNAPEYILFLLKITFAICIMLFIPSLVLGLGKE